MRNQGVLAIIPEPALQVGDDVEVGTIAGYLPRTQATQFKPARIVRETRTRWILSTGQRVDKQSLTVREAYTGYDTFIRAAKR